MEIAGLRPSELYLQVLYSVLHLQDKYSVWLNNTVGQKIPLHTCVIGVWSSVHGFL